MKILALSPGSPFLIAIIIKKGVPGIGDEATKNMYNVGHEIG